MRRGADDFIKKPYTRARPGLKDTVEGALRAAGHESHADCAHAMQLARGERATAPPGPAGAASRLRFGVTGRWSGNTADITLNGQVVTLPNNLFAPLLTLI